MSDEQFESLMRTLRAIMILLAILVGSVMVSPFLREWSAR